MKTIWKGAISMLFIVVLLITYTAFTGTVDPRSYFFPLLQQSQQVNFSSAPCYSQVPLKVYMYELPRRFHVGMMNRRRSEEGTVNARNLPPWPRNSGLKKQHSVEYWMMASLLYEWSGNDENREAVRVLDPVIADVFFVPFFSSLSFNTHGHNMTDPATEFDRQLQVDVMKFLRQSSYWQTNQGRDHVIPMHHPNAFRFLRDQINSSILIVADFGRYSRIVSNLTKDVVAPYVHVVDSFTDDFSPNPYETRTTLLFFRGRTARKDEGIVRAKLKKILVGYEDVHYENSYANDESIKVSSEGMRLSKFCLTPAGDTPSSNRLFDAIASHCVPVIVSDQIELPFEDELDYTKFSIFFSVKEALIPGYMVNQLRQLPKEKWLEMWKQLVKISHHFEYQYPPKEGDAVNMIWRQVKHKLNAMKLAVHRNRRLKIPDWWGRR
ncbi:probable arabinosyltransferase ARAD1 [Impatiens glandulifera]|uniref:probable arabinosyltransferase ARAD1 n=1 Tax=Impatiens glandulifera TaxID=253017 RepID=UPI001FB0A92A|nr:probable arabinosyltransferase ARAD1 [Impatiens glandulifera]